MPTALRLMGCARYWPDRTRADGFRPLLQLSLDSYQGRVQEVLSCACALRCRLHMPMRTLQQWLFLQLPLLA